jgi:hypothetical protein
MTSVLVATPQGRQILLSSRDEVDANAAREDRSRIARDCGSQRSQELRESRLSFLARATSATYRVGRLGLCEVQHGPWKEFEELR